MLHPTAYQVLFPSCIHDKSIKCVGLAGMETKTNLLCCADIPDHRVIRDKARKDKSSADRSVSLHLYDRIKALIDTQAVPYGVLGKIGIVVPRIVQS